MPKVTEAHVEARKAQILGAACICVANKGFHHTTMQDICQEAGLSPGAVYGYFSSKEDIIRSLAEEGLRKQDEVFGALQRERDAPRALLRFAETVIELLDCPVPAGESQEGDPHRLRVLLWAEAIRSPEILEIVRAHYLRGRAALEEIVRRGLAGGEVRPGVAARAVAQLVLSMIDGFVLQKAVDPDLDGRRYVEGLRMLLDGTWWTVADERDQHGNL
jgi:AcrR family transcriptional regulator